MDVEQIKAALATAVALRPPRFAPDFAAGLKVRALEDYLLESAFAQAELEEALYWLEGLTAHFKTKIEQMTGFETVLPSKPQSRITREDVLQAKRTLDPTTFEAGAEARRLRESVLRQIERFRFEAGQGPISRAYTLISGG